MSGNRAWTGTDDDALVSLVTEHGQDWGPIAEAMGRTENSVRIRFREGVKRGRWEIPAPKGFTSLDSGIQPRITSLDELLKQMKVDLSLWEVVEHTVNKWEVGAVLGDGDNKRMVVEPLYQVKARLKPRKGVMRADDFIAGLAGQMKKLGAGKQTVAYKYDLKGKQHLLEVDPFDVHFGKYCWGEETVSDFDVSIAGNLFRYAIEDLIQKAGGFGVERSLFVVGNDVLHVDGPKGQTFAGTAMDVDTRFAKVFMRAHELHSWAIRRLLKISPVDIVVVAGNHDTTAAWHLGHVLATEFKEYRNVTVENTTRPRKYYAYGTNLLGFAHGDRGKEADLPLLMAREEPEKWAAAQHREWHIGHKHKYSEMKWRASESYAGVIVRTLNTITAHDFWHTAEGYTDRRAMQAFIHNKHTGYVGSFSANIFHDGSIPKVA